MVFDHLVVIWDSADCLHFYADPKAGSCVVHYDP